MCGLAGFFQPRGLVDASCENVLRSQIHSLMHRGPDDGGTWVDRAAGIALGHRRLAVLELSPAGAQPMVSASGRYVIAYNGEIYNHLEIRRAMEPTPSWRGNSDTETMLAGFDHWGVEQTLRKTLGMFAFALWDRQTMILTLARDRMGEKPLYYGWQGDVFLFGSEIKALRLHPAFRAELDRQALAIYMRNGYIAAPDSIYQDIRKLRAGTYLQVSFADSPRSAPAERRYWSLRQAVESGQGHPLVVNDAEAIDALESELKRAIAQQSVADVPLGAFLSGGIDSTTVVALMQAQASRPVRTFTVGFHEAGYQEAEYAKSAARLIGTDHTELYVTARETAEVIPRLPDMFDEPFGDSSAIPTFLISQFARRHVTVALSGDGGDELFGGYTRYKRTDHTWRAMKRIPYAARKVLAHGCGAVGRRAPNSATGWKAERLALYLSARTAEECYAARILQYPRTKELVLGSADGGDREPARTVLESPPSHTEIYSSMMYADAMTYLPDDILTKVDRAAMSVSLETRTPMLDHRVVEFAWRLPLHLKVRNGEAKWLLKRVLERHVPAALIERPKMGFGVPVGEWIRGPLRAWAEDLLCESRLRREGYLNPRLIRELWSRHVKRVSAAGDGLWQVLMFQAWLSGSGRASVPADESCLARPQ